MNDMYSDLGDTSDARGNAGLDSIVQHNVIQSKITVNYLMICFLCDINYFLVVVFFSVIEQ